jgi:hypothetical protein
MKASNYMARVHDIILHDINPRPPFPTQRLYRVVEVALGGTNQEGVVVLECIGLDVMDGREIVIPHLLLDDLMRQGLATCIWSAKERSSGRREACGDAPANMTTYDGGHHAREA